MPKSSKAILDTSALLGFYTLGYLSHLNLLFSEVLIPRAVEAEFLNGKQLGEIEISRRFDFINRFYIDNNTWFRPCEHYDEGTVQLFMTLDGMHRGESEALAQNQTLGSVHLVILDERVARNVAQSDNVKVRGTLALLAHLHIVFKVGDYFQNAKELRQKLNFYASESLIVDVLETVKSNLI